MISLILQPCSRLGHLVAIPQPGTLYQTRYFLCSTFKAGVHLVGDFWVYLGKIIFLEVLLKFVEKNTI